MNDDKVKNPNDSVHERQFDAARKHIEPGVLEFSNYLQTHHSRGANAPFIISTESFRFPDTHRPRCEQWFYRLDGQQNTASLAEETSFCYELLTSPPKGGSRLLRACVPPDLRATSARTFTV